jgi:hypothetical protein
MPPEDTSAEQDTTEEQPESATDDGDLGDAGKRALEDERRARRDAEKAAKEARKQLDALKQASMNEQEKAVEAARAEGRAEATKSATARIVASEIRAAAGRKLADPEDAVRLLDHDDFVGEDGEINNRKLGAAIDRLLKDKPYLGGATPRTGTPDQGPQGNSPEGFDADRYIRGLARR